MNRPDTLATALTCFALAACGDSAPENAAPRVERTQLGDTTVVRTISGSVWGEPATLVPEMHIGELDGAAEYLLGSVRSLAVAADGTIYVVDGHGPDLRAYAPDGTYRGTLGRPGEGPGELKRPDGGLAVLSDGRILVRDPGNARIQVFGPDHEPLDTWPLRGGFNTSTQFYHDWEDNVYVSVLVDPEADLDDWVVGLVRMHPDGTPGDTLLRPDTGFESPYVEARSEDGNSASRNGVPFSAREETARHPAGYWIHSVSTAYRIDLLKPEGPLRIERAYEPVPVASGEKREDEMRVLRSMRYTDPNWRWNGPSIPDHKPPFQNVQAGRDGRIWVQLSQRGVRGEDPSYDPSDPDAVPDEWAEPVAFDVFEEDGTYLGRVNAPEGFSMYPTPVFDTEYVWATTRDEFDVNRVVRFRIERAAETDDQ